MNIFSKILLVLPHQSAQGLENLPSSVGFSALNHEAYDERFVNNT
jgi:hypothetical protein